MPKCAFSQIFTSVCEGTWKLVSWDEAIDYDDKANGLFEWNAYFKGMDKNFCFRKIMFLILSVFKIIGLLVACADNQFEDR